MTLQRVSAQAGQSRLDLSVEEAEQLIRDLQDAVIESRRISTFTPIQLTEDGYLNYSQTREFFSNFYETEARIEQAASKMFNKLLTAARMSHAYLEVRCAICHQAIATTRCRQGGYHRSTNRNAQEISARSIVEYADDFKLSIGQGQTFHDLFRQLVRHLPIETSVT